MQHDLAMIRDDVVHLVPARQALDHRDIQPAGHLALATADLAGGPRRMRRSGSTRSLRSSRSPLMPFVSFREYYPELAERETRTVTLLEDADGLPA